MVHPKRRSLFTQVISYVAVATSLSLEIGFAEKRSLESWQHTGTCSNHLRACKHDRMDAKQAMDGKVKGQKPGHYWFSEFLLDGLHSPSLNTN